jgi:acetolactate synthase regulatory subunit
MSQYELDSAVAQATGESLRTIRRRGFSIVDPEMTDFDSEPNCLPAQMVDWDALDAQQRAA